MLLQVEGSELLFVDTGNNLALAKAGDVINFYNLTNADSLV